MSLVGNLKNSQDEIFGKKDNFIPDSEGFLKPIRYLAAQVFAGMESRMRLNELVTEVHFALENDVEVPAGLPKNGVYVKTASGNEYWARYCIITFTVTNSGILQYIIRIFIHTEAFTGVLINVKLFNRIMFC